jgi:hypothetical protein
MAVYICVKCREIVPEKGLKKHRCEKAVVNTRDLMDQLGPRTELQARHNQVVGLRVGDWTLSGQIIVMPLKA